jgi:hypothetical protein
MTPKLHHHRLEQLPVLSPIVCLVLIKISLVSPSFHTCFLFRFGPVLCDTFSSFIQTHAINFCSLKFCLLCY